jgi:DNA-binding response OmpR family regulator
VFPKLGERYFVPKPIENEDLIKRVNTILSQIEHAKEKELKKE